MRQEPERVPKSVECSEENCTAQVSVYDGNDKCLSCRRQEEGDTAAALGVRQ